MALVARTWNGMTILDQINRAGGRAIVGIGVGTAIETKRVTHVLTGTLRRSVHAAPPIENHGADQDEAEVGTDLLMSSTNLLPTPGPLGPMIEVGSWIVYAHCEWVTRGHPGVTQGLEAMRGAPANMIVAQAFREEGL